jgi:rRNA biogenesis protein RRP5
MGAFKRKADQGTAPAKKESSGPQDRSAKRQRKSDAAENPPPVKAKQNISTENSIFKDEEKAFPRGGASVLTPMEHKQIQIKANQDVLFEQAGGKRRGGDDGMSDEGSDMGEDDDAPTKSKKRRSKKNKNALGEEEEVQKIRAEGLTFKVRSGRGDRTALANVCRISQSAPSFWDRSSTLPRRILLLPFPMASWDTYQSPQSPTSSTSG